MASRKRGRAEMEADETPKPPGLLSRLRNMWEFANIMQFIYIFGKALKIDEDFDIEDLEDECLKPEPSHKLAEIALCLLKFVSSHKGLTLEVFDHQARRKYAQLLPERNPFGDEERPKKFLEFDTFTKLRVLWQLSQWVFLDPIKLREKMPETKDADQISWRIEEIGYDRKDRHYFVLDDNRLYRRTDPAPAPAPASKAKPKAKAKAKGKAKGKKFRTGERSSKRMKMADNESSEVVEEPEDEDHKEETEGMKEEVYDTFGGYGWECVAITLSEYHEFLDSIKKSRDSDERDLHAAITEDILPVIEKLEEARRRKIERRQRELLAMEKMAHAKRSSRLASKQEREKQEAEAAAAEKKRQEDLAAAQKDAARQKEMDAARQSRMQTREQRLKDREYKRLLHEEELANLSEDSKKLGTGDARMSERHLKAEMAKKKKLLEELQEEDEWVFDCAKCGVHGANLDDGTHSVACERCNVWQHSACLDISQDEAEKDDFHFVCSDCIRREEDAKKPKIPTLKFKVGPPPPPPPPSSILATETPSKRPVGRPRKNPVAEQGDGSNPKKRKSDDANGPKMPPMKKFKHFQYPGTAAGATTAAGKFGGPNAFPPPPPPQAFQGVPAYYPQIAPSKTLNGTFEAKQYQTPKPAAQGPDVPHLHPNSVYPTPPSQTPDHQASISQSPLPPQGQHSPIKSMNGTPNGHQHPPTASNGNLEHSGAQSSPENMRHALMNGPTLSPQGQVAPLPGTNGHQEPKPPPGLASPTRTITG